MREEKKKIKGSYSYFLMLSLTFFVIILSVPFTPGSLMRLFGIYVEAEAAVTLNNPVIKADSSMKSGQKVTYDCVWFGSYPQTEIVDQPSTCGGYDKVWLKDSDYEVNKSLYTSLSNLTGWDSNNDITYQNVRYHRMKKGDALQTNTGGNYYTWNDDTTYHFFRYEEIKWRVLKVKNGKALLLTDMAIDCNSYATNGNNCSWEKSLARKWLNNNFYDLAFTNEEQSQIETTTIVNTDNGAVDYGEKDTEDKIFFLSESEVNTDSAVNYGFLSDGSKSDEARMTKSSIYVKALGESVCTGLAYPTGNTSWRLRSPGKNTGVNDPVMNRRYISWGGAVGNNGYSAYLGIRPALNLVISDSDSFVYAGTVCTDGTENEVPYESSVTAKYTVSYDMNGGVGSISKQTKEEGLDLVLSTTQPTRTDYEFMGWGTGSSSTSVSYHPGDTYNLNQSITLYAIWRKTITLTLHPNGGMIGNAYYVGNTMYAYNAVSSRTFTISSFYNPTRNGYEFIGWNLSATATTATYQAGDSITISSDTTLYAVWAKESAVTTYTVSYNANGGSNAPASQIKTEGTDLTLSNSIPERTGYTFLGWGTSSISATVTYQPGDTYSQEANIILYAKWRKGIILTYNGNGASSSVPYNVTGYCYNAETSYTFTISDKIPIKSGYSFLGWSKSSTATSASYHEGDKITLKENTTLYAVWEEIPPETYTVTYHANGGTGAPGIQIKTEGKDIILSSRVPDRSGYTFLGWGTDDSSTDVTYLSGATYSKDADIILYAIWSKTVTLTYNANGGTGAPGEQSGVMYNSMVGYTFPISTSIPLRSGFIFAGWGDSKEASSTYGSGEQITISENKTLYAIWMQNQTVDEKVTLTYSIKNGGDSIPASRTVIKGRTVKISGLYLKKDGFEFLGWSENENAETASFAPDDQIDLYRDTTLYAIWNKTVTLSYDDNCQDIVSGVPYAQSNNIYNRQEFYTFTIDDGKPVRDGYDFLGWNHIKDAVTANYAAGDQIDISSDTILYAVWRKNGEKEDSSETKPAVKNNQTITASNKTVAIKSRPFKIGAKSSGNGKLTYSSSSKSVATISPSGVITPKNYGETTITIRAAATSTYYQAKAKKIKITVVPKKMVLKSAKPASNRGIALKWNKDKTSSGYEVQICLRKDFKAGAYQRFYKVSTVRKKITNLKKKTWYVRIRAYKKIGKKTYNGIWSNVRKAKVK